MQIVRNVTVRGGCTIPKKPNWPLSFIVANITLRGFVENPPNFGILNLFAPAPRGFRNRDRYFLQKPVFENLKWGGRRFGGSVGQRPGEDHQRPYLGHETIEK